jgi:hypothetical protein
MTTAKPSAVIARSASDEAIHSSTCTAMDCFAALAMTDANHGRHSGAMRSIEPGISRHNLEIPDRSAPRTVRNDNNS